MTLEDKVHAFRLRVLQRAQELGNVSAACRKAGISRTLFYRWKKRFTRYGIDGLHPRRTATHPGRPVQLDPLKDRRVVAMALACPTWGPQRLSDQLRMEGMVVSQTTVWRALHRLGLGTRTERLLVLEVHSAKSAGLLTDRTRRNLSRRKVRHVQAEQPGELVCIDTFYIGNLKGVGKMWQLTACDAASSYAMAKVVSANNATEAATFLRDVVGFVGFIGFVGLGGEPVGEVRRPKSNVRGPRSMSLEAWKPGSPVGGEGTLAIAACRVLGVLCGLCARCLRVSR